MFKSGTTFVMDTKNSKPSDKAVMAAKPVKQVKLGHLGGDLAAKFQSNNSRFFRPTKPGGRNGQGKPN
jgi:hypothetical protein